MAAVPSATTYNTLLLGYAEGLPTEFLSIISGLKFPLVAAPKMVTPSEASCIISTNKSSHDQYVHSGGTVISPCSTWPSGTTAEPALTLPFATHDFGWITEEEEFAVKAVEIRCSRYGKGFFVELPEGLLEGWRSTTLGVKHFYCGQGVAPYATENTVFFAKENIQRILLAAIQLAHHKRQLPLIGVSRYPKGVSNIFCYRFDCDGGSPEDMERIISEFTEDVPFTSYYFNVSTYSDRPDLAKNIVENGGRVDNHSFIHKVFNTPFEEKLNIKRAHDWIKSTCQRPPRGFVCPGSGYNPDVLPRLIEYGYRYFNSYGFDHSTLPYRMVIEGGISRIWNMAYHPVSLGRLLGKIGYDYEQIIAYYEAVIATRQHRREPHFYYCHPEGRIGKYPEVYTAIRNASLGHQGVSLMHVEDYVDFIEKSSFDTLDAMYDTATNTVSFNNSSQWASANAEPWIYSTAPITIPTEKFEINESHLTSLDLTLGTGDTITRPPNADIDEVKKVSAFYAHDDWRIRLNLLVPQLYEALRKTKRFFKEN